MAALRAGDGGVGAVASFIGTVRDRSDGRTVAAMELEHYPGMTEAAIEAMIDQAFAPLRDPRGARSSTASAGSRPGEQIVLVAVASAHRGEAFQACEFLMDYLKTQRAVLEEGGDRRRARAGSTRAWPTTRRWRAGASRRATPPANRRRRTASIAAMPLPQIAVDLARRQRRRGAALALPASG